MQQPKAVLFTVVFSLLTLLARPAIGAEPVGQLVSAAALAEKLKEYRAIHSLEATFKQSKRFRDMTIELKSAGRFKLERSKGVVTWEVLRPSPLKATLSRDEMRIESGSGPTRDANVIKLAEAGGRAASGLGMLVAWLELDAEKLAKDYAVTKVGERAYRFVPKDKAQNPFKELELWLDANGFMAKLQVQEISGDRFDIEFSPPKISRNAK